MGGGGCAGGGARGVGKRGGCVESGRVAAGAEARGRGGSGVVRAITSGDRASDYLKALWPKLSDDLDWQPVHPYYRRQHINRGMLILLLATLATFGVAPFNAATIIATTLASMGLAWVVWRTATPSFARTGFAQSDGYLHVRRGAVSPRRWIVAASRIQAVILQQSLFQRRHCVMNVEIDVNGLASNQHITIPNLPRAQAEKMQMELTPHGSGH